MNEINPLTEVIPLYQSAFYLPKYRSGTIGNWSIRHCGLGICNGYFTGNWLYQNQPLLLRRRATGEEWETWMSLTPYEMESQELCCRYACGHTVIMGLGMGWVAINAALNQRVTAVTVIERDTEVIELFHHSVDADSLPAEALNKIRIVQADALLWQPDTKVDFLYADIWLRIDEPQTVQQMQVMQQHIQAEQIYFWGQEYPLYRAAVREGVLTQAALVTAAKKSLQLPLLIPEDYATLITQLAAQQKMRGKGMD